MVSTLFALLLVCCLGLSDGIDVATRLALNPGVRRSIEVRDSKTGSLFEINLVFCSLSFLLRHFSLQKASDDVAVLEKEISKMFGSSDNFNIAEVAMEARVPSSQGSFSTLNRPKDRFDFGICSPPFFIASVWLKSPHALELIPLALLQLGAPAN